MAEVSIILKGIDQASGVVEGVGGALSGLGSIAGGVLAGGLALGAAGLAGLAAGGAIALSAAMENEQAQSRLAQVLRSTGGAAGLTQDAANALAGEFAHLAGGSDDAILAIETIGLRAGTIAADQFPTFIQTSLDLGQVMGSTEAAAILLARAGDDIGAAIGKAEKAGILFTDAQREQMIALQESGDAAGAMELFMGRLAEATGGAALANSQTLTGQIELFKGQLGEAAETVGTAFLPLATQLFQGVIAPAIPIVTSLAGTFATFVQTLMSGDTAGALAGLRTGLESVFGPEVTTFVTNLVAQIGSFITTVVTNWPQIQATIESVWTAVQPVLQTAGDFIVNTLIPLFQQGVAWVQTNWPTIQAKIEEVMVQVQSVINTIMGEVIPFAIAKFTEIKAWVDENWPLIQATIDTVVHTIQSIIETVVGGITAFWTEHGDMIKVFAETTWANIKIAIDTAIHVIEGILKTVMLIITGDWSGAWETIKATLNTIWEGMKEIADNNVRLMQTVIQDVIASLKTWWDGKWNEIKTSISTIIQDILTNVRTKIDEIKASFINIDWLAIGTGIIDGIRNGIGNAIGGLVAAAADAAWQAYQAALNALGIGSPSKLFAGIGKNVMESMAGGIQATAGVPAAAIQSATGNLDGTGDRAFSRGGPTTSSITVNIDARGAAPGVGREVEQAVRRGLSDAARRGDARLRLRGAM